MPPSEADLAARAGALARTAQEPAGNTLLAGLANGLPVGVWLVQAPSGRHVYANPAFSEILGHPERVDLPAIDCAGAYGFRTFRGEPYPDERLPFAKSLAARRAVVVDDLVVHRRDGTRRQVRIEARPILDAASEPTHVVHAVVDLTRDIAAAGAKNERELRQLHELRMAEICRIARCHGRDVDEALGDVRRTAAELRARESDAPRTAALARLELAVERAFQGSRLLLALIHGANGLYRHIDVDQLVLATARGMSGGPDDGNLMLHLASRSGDVLGEPGDLERLVVALAAHVRGEIHPHACLRVRTYDVDANGAARAPTATAVAAAPHTVIELAAGEALDGAGLETRDGADSLRQAGIGHDLGLVLDNHGAAVELLEGPGSRMARLLLPARRTGLPSIGSHEVCATVLLVDDDQALRHATARALRALGYLVLTAPDGADALDIYRACHEQIDLVVLDVQMPRLGAVDCLPAMRAIDPAPSVILVSGAKLPHALDLSVRDGEAAFLRKPYDLDVLAATLLTRNPLRGRTSGEPPGSGSA
jgi:CheY-like chemotaxis protein